MKIKIKEFDKKCFDQKSAKFLYDLLKKKIKDTKKINVAFSGGNTPLPILFFLKDYDLDWSKINPFMVDERNVPNNHLKSNFYNLNKFFFDHINCNLLPMNSNKILSESRLSYEKFIFKNLSSKNKNYFDLILLGMGNDGHIASLFPQTKALLDKKNCVAINYIPKLNESRITLTFKSILSAKEIILITKSKEKKDWIKSNNAKILPIGRILDHSENLTWICEK